MTVPSSTEMYGRYMYDNSLFRHRKGCFFSRPMSNLCSMLERSRSPSQTRGKMSFSDDIYMKEHIESLYPALFDTALHQTMLDIC